jgi:serine/threonine protein kinase
MTNTTDIKESKYRLGQQVGDYNLERNLGVGGAGEVWLAKNTFTGMEAAIKFCHDPIMQATLLNEARSIGELLQANAEEGFPAEIVRLQETHLNDDPPRLVMEYCAGGDCRDLLTKHQPLPETLVLHVMRSVLRALSWAHDRGIIHRDIKPENILLKAPYEPGKPDFPVVKVGDFGLGLPAVTRTLSIHRSLGSAGLSEVHGSSSGTLEYMAPEQLENEALSPATDVYAAGVVMFELLTGKRPKGKIEPSSLRSDIQPFWNDLFDRCYAYNQADRFDHAAAMLQELDILAERNYLGGPTTDDAPIIKKKPNRGSTDSFKTESGAVHLMMMQAKKEEEERQRKAAASSISAVQSGFHESDIPLDLVSSTRNTLGRARQVQVSSPVKSMGDVHKFSVKDAQSDTIVEGQLSKGYGWPYENTMRPERWDSVMKFAKSFFLMCLVISFIPVISGIIPARFTASFFLGGYLLAVFIDMFLGDLARGVDGEKKTRVVLHALGNPKAVLARCEPSENNNKYLEIRGVGHDILGYLHVGKGSRVILTDDAGHELLALKRSRKGWHLPSGIQIGGYLFQGDKRKPALVIGRTVHGDRVIAKLRANELANIPGDLLMIASSLISIRKEADWLG